MESFGRVRDWGGGGWRGRKRGSCCAYSVLRKDDLRKGERKERRERGGGGEGESGRERGRERKGK